MWSWNKKPEDSSIGSETAQTSIPEASSEPVPSPIPKLLEVHLPEEISSERFPLTDGWLKALIAKRLFYSVFISLLILLWLFSEDAPQALVDTLVTKSPIIFLLSLSLLVSIIAAYQVFQAVRYRRRFKYNFTSTGIDFGEDENKQTLSYQQIKKVKIKRNLVDLISGYSVLWIFYDPSPEPQVKLEAKTIIRGLKVENAKFIEDFLVTSVIPKNQEFNSE